MVTLSQNTQKLVWSLGKNIPTLGVTPFMLCITVFLVGCVNPLSIFSFIIYISLTLGLSKLALNDRLETIIRLYCYYTILAIILYAVQYLTLPEYRGFTGAPGGTGTDDFRYFAGAVGFNTELIHLYDLPFEDTPPFALFLKFLTVGLPHSPLHLLDFLLINVMALTFIPVLTAKVALMLTGKKEISRMAFILSLFCPYYLANGLVLMRDAWIAMLIIAGIYFLLNRKYIYLILTVALCSYMRMAAGLLLIAVLCFFAYNQFRIHPVITIKKVLFILISLALATAVAVLMFPFVYQYVVSIEMLHNIFFREVFVEGFIADSVAQSGETSALYIIYQKPWFIRVPLGFLFFLGAPFLSIKELSYNGILIPRSFILGLFPFLFLAYFKWFIQAVASIIKEKRSHLTATLVSFLALLLVVSQMSIQFRHKTMLMPLFYLIVSFGFYQHQRSGVVLGYVGALSLAMIQIVYLLKQ